MFVLRPYQKDATQAVINDLTAYDKLGVIAPTGAGKTVMMLEIAEQILKTLGQGHHVIIVSHLSILQNQTLQGFQKHSKYKTSQLQGNIKPHFLSRIIITTMQSLRNEKSKEHIEKRLLNNKTALILIDEAQMYGSNSYTKIENMYGAKIVGFSASPYRGNKYSFNQFDKVSYAISLQELIDKNYLVEPRLKQIDVGSMSIPDRIAHIIALILDDRMQTQLSKGSLIYWHTKDDAKLAASAFNASGIPSAFLTDKTPANRRDNVLQGFNDGKYQVIHNVNVLSAGYDSPHVFNIFMPMGTSSPTAYIQRIGRGLRLLEGKSHCDIYCYGDAPSIQRNLFTRIHKVALKVKDDPESAKINNGIYDQLEWLELQENPNQEKIKYTKEMISIHKHLDSIGLHNIARLVKYKKFPKRYLRNLITAQARRDAIERTSISDMQKQWLEAKNIDPSSLNRTEADILIRLIQGHLSKKWVVKYGLHENKTIDEVPMAYIGALIKKKQYKHPVVQLYTEWKQKGKPYTA
jgi:superfamily II DNA or RNA helicase